MKKSKEYLNLKVSKSLLLLVIFSMVNCTKKQEYLEVTSYETSASGKKLELLKPNPQEETKTRTKYNR